MAIYKSSTPTKDGRLWFFKISRKIDGKFKPYISKKYKTKAECAKAETLFLASNFELDGSNATIQDLFNGYVSKKEKEIKPQTISKMHDSFKHASIIKNIQANKLTVLDYERFKTSLDNKGFTTLYKNKIHNLIKSIFLYGAKYYSINNNVVNIAGGFVSTEHVEKKQDFYTYEEYQVFRQHIDDIEWLSFFDSLYYLGLRKGECNALNWNDIDFINKTINVNKNVVINFNKVPFSIGSTKTKASNRALPIPNRLLEEYKVLYEYYSKFIDFSNDWFVFGGFKPFSNSTITSKKNKIAKQANLKQIRTHDFRHSCASLLINNGATITVVAQYLGHTDIKMTLNTYTHFYKSKLVEITDLINNL